MKRHEPHSFVLDRMMTPRSEPRTADANSTNMLPLSRRKHALTCAGSNSCCMLSLSICLIIIGISTPPADGGMAAPETIRRGGRRRCCGESVRTCSSAVPPWRLDISRHGIRDYHPSTEQSMISDLLTIGFSFAGTCFSAISFKQADRSERNLGTKGCCIRPNFPSYTLITKIKKSGSYCCLDMFNKSDIAQ